MLPSWEIFKLLQNLIQGHFSWGTRDGPGQSASTWIAFNQVCLKFGFDLWSWSYSRSVGFTVAFLDYLPKVTMLIFLPSNTMCCFGHDIAREALPPERECHRTKVHLSPLLHEEFVGVWRKQRLHQGWSPVRAWQPVLQTHMASPPSPGIRGLSQFGWVSQPPLGRWLKYSLANILGWNG